MIRITIATQKLITPFTLIYTVDIKIWEELLPVLLFLAEPLVVQPIQGRGKKDKKDKTPPYCLAVLHYTGSGANHTTRPHGHHNFSRPWYTVA